MARARDIATATFFASLPAWRPLRWAVYALVVAVVGVNLWLLHEAAQWWRHGLLATDWHNISNLPANPYENRAFRWTPPAGWIWTNAIVPLGIDLWRLLHLAVLALLPLRVAALALLLGPFWIAVEGANMIVFAFVAAWHALRDRRGAVIIFVILAALVPRPLMLPVLAVCLWRHGYARMAFAAAALLVIVWGLVVGQFDDMFTRLLLESSGELTAWFNLAPSREIGIWWLPIGVILAAVLMRLRYYGLASLAMSPYLFAAYLMFGLLDLQRLAPATAARTESDKPTSSALAIGSGSELVPLGIEVHASEVHALPHRAMPR